ncbi:4-(cytidine 5'-diphospho)-2-C-methyl-D-erythritol kinase [Pseudohongiella nitratireducens]|nr:4-(cytidine 5'-diphospho)-2-C-methyl-D-erythritol kinase [Pseudohongiella nitratireducens]MDF1624279.1 4-(cytidine 5'-diphospho)-2-C-methyl-D-erythritol kinase [Pseudohongiella nitratireducens]
MSENSTRPLRLPAPAKLNLFLHITGRRPDGYHELQTLFQLLDHGDELEISIQPDGQITFECQDQTLGAPDNNLVVRAARQLQQHTRTGLGAHITLYKHLPAGAGLGGGSSDAATTLIGLNHLWQTNLTLEALAELGVSLGADVPVFVMGHSAWAEGIGEKLTPVTLPEPYFVVLSPACHVNTGEIFSHQQLTRDSSPIKIAAFLAGQSRNDCEPLVRRLYPEVDSAIQWLSKFGPARLTGTGSSVFAPMASEQAARNVLQALNTAEDPALSGTKGWIAKGVNRSPVLKCL